MCNVRCKTSSHGPLSLQSYGAELDVNKKEPSPFQFNAASLLSTQSKAKMSRQQDESQNSILISSSKLCILLAPMDPVIPPKKKKLP
jgi:hypothetical protein